MTTFSEDSREVLANHLVDYANEHGLWPTIDFMVKRWVEKNPEYFFMVKNAITEERNNLKHTHGGTDKGDIGMKRIAEVPEKIWVLIDKLFPIEKKNYVGGEKKFWRDFSDRYPVFRLGIDK